MRLNKVGRMISGAAMTLALMFGITVAAQAQYRNYDYRYGDQVRWSKGQMQDFALKAGYNAGYKDARQLDRNGYGRSGNYKDSHTYRQGTDGWNSYMGDIDDYKKAFRKGYETGWKDRFDSRQPRYVEDDVHEARSRYGDYNYDDYRYGRRDDNRYGRNDGRRGHDDDYRYDDSRYGRYDRNQVYRIAQQNGYNEGLRHGQNDRSRNRSYDYEHTSEYRNGTHGYRSEYGDRNLYRQAFQEGYRRGYDEGYRRRNTSSRFPWPF